MCEGRQPGSADTWPHYQNQCGFNRGLRLASDDSDEVAVLPFVDALAIVSNDQDARCGIAFQEGKFRTAITSHSVFCYVQSSDRDKLSKLVDAGIVAWTTVAAGDALYIPAGYVVPDVASSHNF